MISVCVCVSVSFFERSCVCVLLGCSSCVSTFFSCKTNESIVYGLELLEDKREKERVREREREKGIHTYTRRESCDFSLIMLDIVVR